MWEKGRRVGVVRVVGSGSLITCIQKFDILPALTGSHADGKPPEQAKSQRVAI